MTRRPSLRSLLPLLLALSVAACAGVLGIHPRDQQHPFEHRAHSLKGINCLVCHEGVQRAGDTGPLHLPSAKKCASCHRKPHDTRDCLTCHGMRHTEQEDELARQHLRFAHAKHVAQVRGQCVVCHVGAGSTEQATLRPPMAQCFTCHVHKDQWRVRDCNACHVDLPAEHVTPTSHLVHDGDFLREHGVQAAASRDLCATCHEEHFCASCHGVTTPALPWKLRFDRPRVEGLHPAGFVSRHADEARASPGLCSTCHRSERFCADCHERDQVGATTPQGGKSPHPPGWVLASGGAHGPAARMDPASCAACHGGAGEMLCVGCHKVGGAGGNPHGPGFNSTLDKTHDTPCVLCHAP